MDMIRPDGEHIKSQKVPRVEGSLEQLQPKLNKRTQFYNYVKKNGRVKVADVARAMMSDRGSTLTFSKEFEFRGLMKVEKCECGNATFVEVVKK